MAGCFIESKHILEMTGYSIRNYAELIAAAVLVVSSAKTIAILEFRSF